MSSASTSNSRTLATRDWNLRQSELRSRRLFLTLDTLALRLLDLRSGKPQTRCDEVSLKHQLPALLPVLLIAVISERPNHNNLTALVKAVLGVVGQWSVGHHPVVDGWE